MSLVRRLARTGPLGTVLVLGWAVGAMIVLPRWSWLSAAVFPALLLASGAFWVTTLTGPAARTDLGFPLSRLGLQILVGLLALPAVALLLHVAGVRISRNPVLLALLAVCALGGVLAEVRGRRREVSNRPFGAWVAAGVTALVATGVGVAAVTWYDRLPRPASRGYTSVALAGWAAKVTGPVTVPAQGLDVPLRIERRDSRPGDFQVTLEMGDRPAGATVRVAGLGAAGRDVTVRVPAPPDGCLHRVVLRLQPLGGTGAPELSTTLYARGAGPC
jgi:hypothetical protein